MTRRTIALAATAVLLLGAGAGCTKASQTSAPDVEPAGINSGTHTRVIQMPSGFRNVAFTCNGHVGVYVTSRGANLGASDDATALPSSISTVNGDPNCA